MAQWYANVPLVNWNVNVPPLGPSVELNPPASAVTVCVAASLFVHLTLSPTLIVSEAGLNAKPATDTLCVAAPGAALADDARPRTRNAKPATASRPARMATRIRYEACP